MSDSKKKEYISVLTRWKYLESILKKNATMDPEKKQSFRNLALERNKKRKQLQLLEKELGPQITSSITNGKSRLSRTVNKLPPIKESPTPSPSSSVFRFISKSIRNLMIKKGGNRTRKLRRFA